MGRSDQDEIILRLVNDDGCADSWILGDLIHLATPGLATVISKTEKMPITLKKIISDVCNANINNEWECGLTYII
jgi:hypothetical protein